MIISITSLILQAMQDLRAFIYHYYGNPHFAFVHQLHWVIPVVISRRWFQSSLMLRPEYRPSRPMG